MRALALTLALCLAAPTLSGCDAPLVVDTDPKQLKRLPLRGEVGKEGVLTRDISVDGKVIKKGTRVVVRETWISRRDKKADPPGYRIGGYYDVTQPSDGFVLPAGRADIYFISALLPQEVGMIPVPTEAFQLTQ